MAGTNKIRVESKQPLEELNIDNSRDYFYNISNTVSIVSLIDAVVKLRGASTGNLYIWNHAGDSVDVDVQDKDEILNKKRGRACCGGQSGKALFQLA